MANCPTLGQIWAHVLSNGKSAQQNWVENQTMLTALNQAIEGSLTMLDLWKIIAAVSAGKSTVVATGASSATVEFQAAGGTDVRVEAQVEGIERIAVTVTPETT